ncbi:hypothetical protein [Kitasatospora sp. NPDC085464]|uniref:hypothetical protein n=1 Tax=Kitasatospora sp. NPDC085464 TaxID=3364063 RepID=UPI0037C6F39A
MTPDQPQAGGRHHDWVGFVRSRLHEELAKDSLHHSTRRALQRRLKRVAEIADQADGTAPASLLGRAEGGAELVNLAQRWRDHPAYPGVRRATESATVSSEPAAVNSTPGRQLPASVVHVYERGITADLLAQVGGYPGLHKEAREELAEQHPCRREVPEAGLPLTITSDDDGFLTVHAEMTCTDRRCRTEAAAVARYQVLLEVFDRTWESMKAVDLLLQQPNLVTTPDPEKLRKRWDRQEKAIRELLREVVDTITPHADPTAE